MPPVIIAKDLYKCYPGFPPVLRGVNLTVAPGEIVAIMGPSGCGKSTMLHLLGMLHPPDAGTLEVLGQDVLALGREATAAFRRGNMGFVMQSSNLFDHSTVFENVEFPLIYENVPPDERWERVIRALELVRLSHRVNYRSNRLSGGEQQRVAVARAMVNNPRILLADEPTGALDARTSKVVMENFRTLAHEGRVAMVVVTHDASVAAYCDSVYTLEEGLLTCQRQNPVPETEARGHLLDVSLRHMNTICVTAHAPPDSVTTQDIYALHRHGVLARVYALQGAGIAALATGDTHGLPVPVRRLGLWGVFLALRALGRQKDSLRHIRQIWQRVPLRLWHVPRLVRAWAIGTRLTAWGKSDKVDHLHVMDVREGGLATWIAAKLLGISYSLSVRAQDISDGDPCLPILMQDAAFTRCPNQTTVDAVQRLYPEASASCILMRGSATLAPPDSEDAMPTPATQSEPEVRLLAVVTLSTLGGIQHLLKASAILKQQNAPFYITIVGNGTPWILWTLRFQAWLRGLRNTVTFLGQVSQDSMPELLQKARIFVSVSELSQRGGAVHDPPTALVEAMTYALPVVVSDTPGHTELVRHEQNGLVVPQGAENALAEALLRLMRFPDLATALGAQAQTDIVHLYGEDHARQLADALLAIHK